MEAAERLSIHITESPGVGSPPGVQGGTPVDEGLGSLPCKGLCS